MALVRGCSCYKAGSHQLQKRVVSVTKQGHIRCKGNHKIWKWRYRVLVLDMLEAPFLRVCNVLK